MSQRNFLIEEVNGYFRYFIDVESMLEGKLIQLSLTRAIPLLPKWNKS